MDPTGTERSLGRKTAVGVHRLRVKTVVRGTYLLRRQQFDINEIPVIGY